MLIKVAKLAYKYKQTNVHYAMHTLNVEKYFIESANTRGHVRVLSFIKLKDAKRVIRYIKGSKRKLSPSAKIYDKKKKRRIVLSRIKSELKKYNISKYGVEYVLT